MKTNNRQLTGLMRAVDKGYAQLQIFEEKLKESCNGKCY